MTDAVNDFIKKKKDESAFIALEDGESVQILRLKEIKVVTKLGFGGEEKEVLRLVVDVNTDSGSREKVFDNGTKRFAEELQTKGVKIGSSFIITRTGLQTKTRYTISAVAEAVAPAAPAAPAVTDAQQNVPAEMSPNDADLNVNDIQM